jgi:hypothetical protein
MRSRSIIQHRERGQQESDRRSCLRERAKRRGSAPARRPAGQSVPPPPTSTPSAFTLTVGAAAWPDADAVADPVYAEREDEQQKDNGEHAPRGDVGE